jgi:uncharacterized protein (TIGR00269 family)
MKCRVCGKPAAISLKSYNTALCEEDFIAFFERRVLRTIQRYHLADEGQRLLVAVSGGKDSLSLWLILNRLGFSADGVYVNLGIGDYSQASLEKTKAFADLLKRKVFVFSVSDTFRTGIDELSRIIRRPPCSACGMIKRYVMNRVCIDNNYEVLATGHNLDDEASALLGNLLYWREEYLWKKNVALEGTAGHLSKKIKPLFLCSEREVAAYAIMNGVDYIYDECPHSEGASSLVYKGVMNRLEEMSPGTKLMFLKGYLKRVSKEEGPRDITYCRRCGYPSFSEECTFCGILDRFGKREDFRFDEYAPFVLDSAEGMVE